MSTDPLTADELAEIRARHQSDMRWCAEVDVPPSEASLDRRALLAEVERLQGRLAAVRRLTVYERPTDGLQYVRAEELRAAIGPINDRSGPSPE